MCGIAGLIEFNSSAGLPDWLARMTQTLSHRGPDGQGIKTQTFPAVGLGHTRLKIIDVSEAAAQPFISDNGRVWISFNGEIYNYRELRQELIQSGVKFRSVSDTEVILRLYEAQGEKAFERLQGMFALGLWDSAKQTLLLARDPLGKKPLFYFQDLNRFAFASEIKALLAHPQIAAATGVHESALPAFFFFGYVPSPETLYRGIYKLPPGHLLKLSLGGQSQIRSFWSLPHPQENRLSQEAAAQRLRQLLTDSVRKRLISDVPLGAFLSGGLDSSIVVALMSHLNPEPVKTFSIGFEGDPHFDETAYARVIARHFGTTHEEFKVQPGSLDLVEKLVYHHDGPFADSSAIPTYLLAQMTRRHVTVALTGDGGDEIFAGYLRFPAALALESLPAWSRRLFEATFSGLAPIGSRRGPLRRLRQLAAGAGSPLLERYSQWVSVCAKPKALLRPEFDKNGQPFKLLEPIFEQSRGGSKLARLLDLNLKTYLPEDLLVKTDRCTMAHGLEARSPFLDRELVEFAFSLPDGMKLRRGQTKYLLRKAFEPIIPPQILKRSKMGFGVPLERWFRGDFGRQLRSLLSGSTVLARYLDPSCLDRLLTEHEQAQADHSQLLWTLLTFDVWLKKPLSRN